LFILENMLVEIILQMLISIVDTKLFKAEKDRELYFKIRFLHHIRAIKSLSPQKGTEES